MPDPIIASRYCEQCRQEIPADRAELLPDTRLCVACSQAAGSEFVLVVSTEQLAKEGSLKRNYGGVTVRKVRRRRG